jgi:hypothetical protein
MQYSTFVYSNPELPVSHEAPGGDWHGGPKRACMARETANIYRKRVHGAGVWGRPSPECYRRAAEARRIADVATDPSTKADFLEIEQRWLFLARSYEQARMLRSEGRERGRR